jgi:hypothetical protein
VFKQHSTKKHFIRHVAVNAIVILSACSFFVDATANNSTGANLQTYAFTKDYITCLKRVKNESLEKNGTTDSSIINADGESANYWNFMNCLNQANSGTVSSTVDSELWCKGQLHSLYKVVLPTARDGKEVTVNNKTFKCNNGDWGFVSELSGVSSSDGDDCSSINKTFNGCVFEIPSLKNNTGKQLVFNAGGLRGDGYFYCKDGTIQSSNLTCDTIACDSSSQVSWFDDGIINSMAGSRLGRCAGVVGENGLAIDNGDDPIRYYPTLEEAKKRTLITVGQASYTCESGRWKIKSNSAICRFLSDAELNCGSRINNGKLEFYCSK